MERMILEKGMPFLMCMQYKTSYGLVLASVWLTRGEVPCTSIYILIPRLAFGVGIKEGKEGEGVAGDSNAIIKSCF